MSIIAKNLIPMLAGDGGEVTFWSYKTAGNDTGHEPGFFHPVYQMLGEGDLVFFVNTTLQTTEILTVVRSDNNGVDVRPQFSGGVQDPNPSEEDMRKLVNGQYVSVDEKETDEQPKTAQPKEKSKGGRPTKNVTAQPKEETNGTQK